MQSSDRRPAAPAPGEILILKPSSLGDVVHTLPCAAWLRRVYPQAKIRWLVNTEWAPLLEGNPCLDEVIEFPRRKFRGVAGVLRIAPWARQLRERVQPDLILDYQGLLRSALIAKLCRQNGCRVLGLSDAREGARFFYDQAADVSGCDHAVDRYLALTRLALGAEAGEATPELEWPLPKGSLPAGFDPTEPFVALHPFSRGAGKSLTIEQVQEFCAALAPLRVVLVGRAEATSVESILSIPSTTDLLNRTTLPELIAVLRRAAWIVSVDSGPMHIASALTGRLISIHTWSDPAKVGPYRPDAWVWQAGQLFPQRERRQADVARKVANFAELAEFVRAQL